ncbi:hypothetical protein NJ7G_2121 [Natrinema sp. J7-2]|nr:hypothetical protein NJ7G_2121 [Natrinema sp. J7-2]
MSLERTDGEGSTDTESEIDDTTDTESPTETDDTGEADSEIEEEEGLTIDDLSEGAKNAGKNAGSCYFRYCI